MYNIFSNNKEESPFPVNLQNYNLFNFDNDIKIWIPISHKKPFIMEQNDTNIFFYVNNTYTIANFLTSHVYYEELSNVEMILDSLIEKADFKVSEDGINLIIFNQKKINVFYYQNENGKNILVRNFKGKYEDLSCKIDFYFDLRLQNKYKPLEEKTYKNNKIKKWYYFNIENEKLYLSFDLKEDRPFEVVIDKDLMIKDYLIPNIKSKRSLIFKPSQVVYNKGVLIDYKYILDNVDYTEEIREILKEYNIENPESYDFKEIEIEEISRKIKALM